MDAYESKKLVATIGLASGAAFSALGVVLYLTRSDERSADGGRREQGSTERARVGVYWAGDRGGVYGAF